MYYLANFCRICIKTGVKLLDINTIDFDKVSISDKLEFCTKMVINRESLSTQICEHCVQKLRISYEFHTMCKQSTKILQGYLSELISTSNKISPDAFVNSELRVTLSPLDKPTFKRKRITKEQRCSLLKKLLTRKTQTKKEKYNHRHRKKFHPKIAPPPLPPPQPNKANGTSGGLRSIIDYTLNYDFGYKIEGNLDNCNFDPTPLSRLTSFTNSFFHYNFADFQNTILYIIESKDNLSESDDDEDMFDNFPNEFSKCEEVVVEPDIKIKTEPDYDDCDNYSCNYYVETSYSDSECKKENCIESHEDNNDENDGNDEEGEHETSLQPDQIHYNSEQSNSVQLLDKLVGNLGSPQRKAFSQHSVRCRTRGNPYISPQLRQQFQFKSFQCDKCNRYFKSPGYLKAHISKIHS